MAARVECGQLVPTAVTPTVSFLEAIEGAVQRIQAHRMLPLPLDERLAEAQSRAVIESDVARLLAWSVRRLIYAHQRGPTKRPTRVLCLLPRSAPVTHLLRRAVPFAALGIPTVVSWPFNARAAGRTAIDAVSNLLDLRSFLKLASVSSEMLIQGAHPSRDLIVATGRRSVLHNIRSRAQAEMIGSAGRCAVALVASRGAAEATQVRLRGSQIAASCSRLRATVLVKKVSTRALGYNPATGRRIAPLEEIVARLHPSIIYDASRSSRSRTDAVSLFGYSVVRLGGVNADAVSSGFGADPVFGWPGDYRV